MKQTTELEYHAAANIFPLTEGQPFKDLIESIQRNGQREPIVLKDGLIADGRNRFRACCELGIAPITREFDQATDGESLLQFVLDHNLHRRHLTPSQRALIGAESLKQLHEEAEAENTANAAPVKAATKDADGNELSKAEQIKAKAQAKKETAAKKKLPKKKAPTQDEMAETMGVSKPTLSKAAKILKESPEEASKVKAGKKSVDKAKEDAAASKAQAGMTKAEIAAVKKRLTKNCGKHFCQAFVDGTVLKTAAEAGKFLALSDELQTEVAPFVATGWAVLKATRFVSKEITDKFTIADMINRAIANDGSFTIQMNGYTIEAVRLQSDSK